MFTQNDVYAASRLPHSKARGDSTLFSPIALRNADKAKEWVKDPDGQYGDNFNKLQVAQFKAHLEEQNKKAKYRHLRTKWKQSSSKGKRPASMLGDSSGEERNSSKYKKSKGKGRKVDTGSDENELKGKKGKGKKVINYMDSDHMDDSN
jgi:hypothetical protein